jgi:hypothetical protein
MAPGAKPGRAKMRGKRDFLIGGWGDEPGGEIACALNKEDLLGKLKTGSGGEFRFWCRNASRLIPDGIWQGPGQQRARRGAPAKDADGDTAARGVEIGWSGQKERPGSGVSLRLRAAGCLRARCGLGE